MSYTHTTIMEKERYVNFNEFLKQNITCFILPTLLKLIKLYLSCAKQHI